MAGYSGRPLDHKSDLQGPESSIYHSTSSVEDTHYSVLLPRSRQAEGAGELGEGYDRKEGCRNSPSTRQSWFLPPSFSSSKEGRYLEAGHRLDLSCLNKMLLIPLFKMETAEHIMEAVRQGEWLTC